MSNVRPAGRMRPANGLNAAREKIFCYVMHAARERMKYIKHVARELISYVMHAAREMNFQSKNIWKMEFAHKMLMAFLFLEKKIFLDGFFS